MLLFLLSHLLYISNYCVNETALQVVVDRLIEVGRFYGMEMTGKSKVIRILKQPFPVHVMIDPKKREDVEYFNFFHSVITNDARCTREIISRISMAKAAFNKKRLFNQRTVFKLRHNVVKCYIWSIACMVLKLGHFAK